MTRIPLSGGSLPVTIALTDDAGNPMTGGIELWWWIDDDEGDTVAGSGNDDAIVPESGASKIDLKIDSLYFAPAFPVGAPSARTFQVQFELYWQDGAKLRTWSERVVVVNGRTPVRFLANSFQGFETSFATATLLPNLDGWNGAADQDRENALIEAFGRLTRLGYRVRRPQDIDVQNTIGEINELEDLIEPRAWPVFTEQRWNNLPQHFRDALCAAQVLEANEILTGDVVGSKRRSGLMSESIGESSMMFRPGKPLDLGVSRRALEALAGYVTIRMTLTRS